MNTSPTALQYLAGNCDFARKQDGAGFNKLDAGFGHSLAEFTASGGTLSANQEAKALEMLRKYTKQLTEAGITLPDKVNGSGESKPTVTLNNQLIMVKFDGKPAPEMLELVRSLPERSWKPDLPGKPWAIPAKYVKQVIKAFGEKAEIGQDVLDFSAWVEEHKNDILPKLAIAKPAQQSVAQQQQPDVKVEITTDKGILLSFRYDPEIVAWIKALPERKWEPELPGKPWKIPERYADKILAKFPDAVGKEKLQEMVNGMAERAEISRAATSDFDVPGLRLPLLPFQRAGVEFIEKAGGRALVADEPGLGKTVEAIAYLQLHPDLRPAVIVVPATLKINWKREIDRFISTKERIVILSGQKAHDLDLYNGTIYIVNYDILSYWADKIILGKPAVIIADEAHYAKNLKSARSKALVKLSKGCKRVILLTGTPVTNRPAELWPLLHMTAPTAWPKFFPFAMEFCGAYSDSFGWHFDGASNLAKLHQSIKPWVIRRRKEDVLKELPDKRHATVTIDFDEAQREQYEAVLNGAISVIKNSLAAHHPENALAEIERAKQAAIHAKMTSVVAWVENFLESNGKLVVFATHQFVVDRLMEKFGEIAVKVTGEITGQVRQKAVDDFQTDDKIRLFVGNIRAAGTGLTLTASSDVAFIEYPWSSGDLLQAADRVHRVGQKNAVTIYYLVADNTIEEDIVEILQEKAKVIGQIHDGDAQIDNVNILNELAKKMEYRKKQTIDK